MTDSPDRMAFEAWYHSDEYPFRSFGGDATVQEEWLVWRKACAQMRRLHEAGRLVGREHAAAEMDCANSTSCHAATAASIRQLKEPA